IAFGWELAKEMGRLDVGQSVAVKERAVLAVGGIAGPDRPLLRPGELCRSGGFVLVMGAQPQRDMRFDRPTVRCTPLDRPPPPARRAPRTASATTNLSDEAPPGSGPDRDGINVVAR